MRNRAAVCWTLVLTFASGGRGGEVVVSGRVVAIEAAFVLLQQLRSGLRALRRHGSARAHRNRSSVTCLAVGPIVRAGPWSPC